MLDFHWVALSLLRNVGIKTISALIETFGSAEAALQADTAALMKVRGIGKVTAAAIREIDLADVQCRVTEWQHQGITIRTAYTPDYPQALQALDDAPATLFIRGTLHPNRKAVAIVGTRSPDNDARQVAFQLGKMLAEQGWTIVSGLAMGIDTAAHEGALSVPNGHTVAVLGSGVLNIYPEENINLAKQMLEHGALVSENHPDATPNAPRLVSRNRIISGLCQHVIIVQTGIDGGAMYAARSAIAQGRTVHAVGFPASGNLELLKNNARFIAPDLRSFTLE
jgi:DNA processing protein